MALINCPECSTEVSDRAPTCPKCGSPIAIKEQHSAKTTAPIIESNQIDISAASKHHRILITSVLVWLIAVIFLRNTGVLFNLIMLAVAIANIYSAYKLATALGYPSGLWVFLSIFGLFVACLPQLLLINSANKQFKSMGLKIGFLGGASKPA